MSDNFDKSQLTHYIFDELSDADARRVEEKLRLDPDFRQTREEQEKVIQLVTKILYEVPVVHPTFLNKKPESTGASRSIFVTAASLTLLLGIFLSTRPLQLHRTVEVTPLAAAVDISRGNPQEGALANAGTKAKKGKRPLRITVVALDSEATFSLVSEKDYILNIVHRHLDDLRSCPGISGGEGATVPLKVTLKWTLNDKGHLLESSTTEASAVGQCFLSKLKTWSFPPLLDHRTLSVSYPFILEP